MTDWTIVVVMIAQILGPLLWRSKFSPTARKLVGVMNLVVSIVTQVLAALTQSMPPEPGAVPANATFAATYAAHAGSIVFAGFFPQFKNFLIGAVVDALYQTFLVTGAFSWTKNTGEGIKQLTAAK